MQNLQKTDVGPNKSEVQNRICDLYYVIVHVIHRSHVNINYVTTHAPPTGDRPRQNEHRRQRSDKSAEHRVERPVIRGHFGLIRPHSAVATCVRNLEHVTTISGQR